jgi:predicted AlkP superfamily pyrophosphatase or phosphodiesterase
MLMKTILLFITIIISFQAYAADLLNNVVIVSIDALHPDAVTRENSPNIMSLADRGVIKLDGRSTTPPKTLISHSAMFTGLTPQTGGRDSNAWKKGDATIAQPTIFSTAKSIGYNTGFVYSKGKLAFLVNDPVDQSYFSKEYPIDKTTEYIKNHDKNFVFLHISGLDFTGPEYGWMSKEYIEDFKFIDEELKPLVETVTSKGKYLLIITSDHAGHDKLHGCDHPDDYKLPFVAVSDVLNVDTPVLGKYETYKLISYLKSLKVF